MEIRPDQFTLLRFKLNYSQQELADWLAVNRSTVSRWEQGRRRIPIAVVKAMELWLEKKTADDMIENGTRLII